MACYPIPFLSAQTKQRLWDKVAAVSAGECWSWTAARDKDGYGVLWVDGRNYRASRLIAAMEHGEPNGRIALHDCDNPSCCNPAHLRWGTWRENMADRSARNRAPVGDAHPSRKKPECLRRGEAHGRATLTEDNVRQIRTSRLPLKRAALLFGVNPKTVWRIRQRKAWAHVA